MRTTVLRVTALTSQDMTTLMRRVGCVSELLKGGNIKLVIGLLSICLAACSNLSTEPKQPSQGYDLSINEINKSIEDAAKTVSNVAIRSRLEILKSKGTNSQKADFIAGARKNKDITGDATFSLPKDLEVLLPRTVQNDPGITERIKCFPSPPECEYIPVCVRYVLGVCTLELFHKVCHPAPDRCVEVPDHPCKPGSQC